MTQRCGPPCSRPALLTHRHRPASLLHHWPTSHQHQVYRPTGVNLHGKALPDVACQVTNTVLAMAAIVPTAALLPSAAEKLAAYLKPRKCKVCYGAGFYPCTTCMGRGKVGGLLPEAGPAAPCTCCVRGRTACTACNKTGLANAWLWQPSSDPGWGARGE